MYREWNGSVGLEERLGKLGRTGRAAVRVDPQRVSEMQ